MSSQKMYTFTYFISFQVTTKTFFTKAYKIARVAPSLKGRTALQPKWNMLCTQSQNDEHPEAKCIKNSKKASKF